MIQFIRSFDFESSNPFRRFANANKNFYIEIRKFMLRNADSSFQGRLSLSGPKEIIGFFCNHIIKLLYKCQSDINELKNLTTTTKELPSISKVTESLLSEHKTGEVKL